MCKTVFIEPLFRHKTSCPQVYSHVSSTTLRISLHSFRQPVLELLGHHHLWLLRLPAPTDALSHGRRHGLPAPPHPGLAAPLQPAGRASDPWRLGRDHAGQRARLPLLPHAPLPSLLPTGALCRHPRTPPLVHCHDPLCMTGFWRGDPPKPPPCSQVFISMAPHPSLRLYCPFRPL